jgi:uncharacterized protein YlxP (DUF503 family)
MFVGVYRVDLFFPASQSLKAKRSILNSLKARLSNLGVAVSEVDGQDLWQRAELGVAAVSADATYLDDLADKIESVLVREPRATVLRLERIVRPVEFDPVPYDFSEGDS